MIDTLRVLVGWKCNLHCSYCCNNQPRFRDQIRPVRLQDLDFSRYRNVCITGGEPLLFPEQVREVSQRAAGCLRILYTNGIFLNPLAARDLEQWGIEAINVGLHLPELIPGLIHQVRQATQYTRLQVRFHLQDKYQVLQEVFPQIKFHFWQMDDCERANEERVVLL